MEYDGKNNNYGEIRIIIRIINIMSIKGFILDRCERGTISNDPRATIIGLELPPSMILENILFQVL